MEVEREMQQEIEWLEAQKIVIGVDLLTAAKQQLKFLAAVDKNRWLYEGPALEIAIYRYNACWLPLLAKHSVSPLSEGPLVVPLDCEWVWHCHRLNPLRYKFDCEKLYGKILDNSNVVSSVHGDCKRQTEEIWNRLYPDEPYDFTLTRANSEATSKKLSAPEKCTTYDLVSAVKRQSPFFYQVSRSHMNNDIFLEEAVARYKGFLHLIKRSKERSIRCFTVPTYDIDLIWHTHQLHPVSYCKDLKQAIGYVLEHDDTDSDRTEGKKLHVGFSGTIKRWEETFGCRYWRAGAMYGGSSPSPVTTIPFSTSILKKETEEFNKFHKMIQLPDLKIVDVLLEIVGVKNLPEGHEGSLYVSFSKKQPDAFFNGKRKLTISSDAKEKQVALFQCEPNGELFFELMSHLHSNSHPINGFEKTGNTSLSLQDFFNPVSKLSLERWVELLPTSRNASSNPICLRIAVSFTVPVQASHAFHMIPSHSLPKTPCLLPHSGNIQNAKSWTVIIDGTPAGIMNLEMRDTTKDKITVEKQVIGLMKSGETLILAEFSGARWSLMDCQWCLQSLKKSEEENQPSELSGSGMVKIFQGRKLDFEPRHSGNQRDEQDFLTAVEFSAEDPYGKALAIIDLKSGFVMVKEDWFVLPGIISAFILSNIWDKEMYDGSSVGRENLMEVDGRFESKFKSNADVTVRGAGYGISGHGFGNKVISGSYGSSCGGKCGGSCCGSGNCGSMLKVISTGGYGSGCGGKCGGSCCGSGSCGSMLKATTGSDGSGCGGKCGGSCCGSGSCGSMLKVPSGSYGSGCGGKCGGSCCGSGNCGSMLKGGHCAGSCGGHMARSGVCDVTCSGAGAGGCGIVVKSGDLDATCAGCKSASPENMTY